MTHAIDNAPLRSFAVRDSFQPFILALESAKQVIASSTSQFRPMKTGSQGSALTWLTAVTQQPVQAVYCSLNKTACRLYLSLRGCSHNPLVRGSLRSPLRGLLSVSDLLLSNLVGLVVVLGPPLQRFFFENFVSSVVVLGNNDDLLFGGKANA